MQNNFNLKLIEQKIPHKISKQGYVLYNSKDKEKLLEISIIVYREYYANRSKIGFKNREHEKKFILLLEQSEIPFHLKKDTANKNLRYIYWEKKYDPAVNKIKLHLKAEAGLREKTTSQILQRPNCLLLNACLC